MRRRHATVLLAALALAAVVAACGDDGADDRGADGGGSLTVFAAASLTDAFDAVADAFEDAHPGTTVTMSFGASSALREQVLEGAPADVFASADESTMEQLVGAGEAVAPRVFATNGLQLVVPAGNEAGVTGLADLARGDLLVGLCAEAVPCGRFAREALALAGVEAVPDTEEPDVRSLLTKVRAGELDLGLVYRTDVLAAGDEVEGIDLPSEHDVVAAYPIAVLTRSAEPDLARAFVAFVRSDEGHAVLAAHGFGAP